MLALALLATAFAAEPDDFEARLCHLDLSGAAELASTSPQRSLLQALAHAHGRGPDLAPLMDLAESGDSGDYGARVAAAGVSSWATLTGTAVAGLEVTDDERAATARWDPPVAPVSLPMSRTPTGLWTIRVRVNGRERRFGLDTGASAAVVSDHLVRRRQRRGSVAFEGHGRQGEAQFGVVDLEVPGVRSEPTTIVVLPRRALAAHGVDGVLGWPMLGSGRVTFDGPARVLHLTASEPVAEPNLVWWDGYALFRGTLLGAPALLWLDTGGAASALYSSSRSRGVPIPAGRVRDQPVLTLMGPEVQRAEAVPGPIEVGVGEAMLTLGALDAVEDVTSWCVDLRLGTEPLQGRELVVDGPAGYLAID